MGMDMRSLSRQAKFDKRVKVIELRHAGRSYVQIALQVGLSRTGVFDICKRHDAVGVVALRDARNGRANGQGRVLTPTQEQLIRNQIIDSTPDALAMSETLWNRFAVSRLIEKRLGVVLPVRTLGLYLVRWGFLSSGRIHRSAGASESEMDRWITDVYPALAARSKAEGGEIIWGSDSKLLAERARRPGGPVAVRVAIAPLRNPRSGLSMISAVTNKGQLRWTTFQGPLNAHILVEFLRRLIRGASKKVFLIMDGLVVCDGELVETWLSEHEDAIEAFHLPTHRRRDA